MNVKQKILQLRSLLKTVEADVDTKASAAEVDEAIAEIDLSTKQDVLVSGTNIKTVNGNSLLGSGDIVITGTTPTVATGAEVDTGTNNDKMVTPKAMEDSSYSKLALGETSATAYRGDRGKTAYDHSQVAHAPDDADNTLSVIVASGTQSEMNDTDRMPTVDENGIQIVTTTYAELRDQLKAHFDSIYVQL